MAEEQKRQQEVAMEKDVQQATVEADEAAGETADQIDPEAQPFELSLYLPDRPLLSADQATAGLPETPVPLKVAVTPQESLNELRVTITDSPEGYWLGAFCFRRPPPSASEADKTHANGNGAHKQLLGERVDEWTELKDVFKDVPRDERTLYVAHVAYNDAEARGHVQRLRELLSGGQADPSAIGIDGGLSVQDAVKNEELWIEEQKPDAAATAAASNPKSKKGSKKQTNGHDAAATSSASNAAATNEAKALFSDVTTTSWKSGDVTNLIPKQVRPERSFPQCLRQLSLAAWTPAPHHLRVKGHFFYLHVITLEAEHLFITACTQGFYVNKSTVTRFDPTPRTSSPTSTDQGIASGAAAHLASSSLFDVLCVASPLFLANFAKLFQDPISQRDYFAVVPMSNCIQAHPWLARPYAHVADPLRAQTAYLLTGATSADALDGTRDWNDEIQSTRELPRQSLQERLMRDRVLNRIYAEFTLAAARAVPRVAAGEVQAMNPMDKRDAQMFIVNNLFISKGVDGVDLYPHMGGDEAAHVAVSKDVQGIRCLNNLDIDGICLLGTVLIDWMGERWVAQSVVPGLFRRRDDEIDQDGNVKPDDGEKKDDTQVVYGGVEGPEVIKDDADFHALFSKVAKSLHLAEHVVNDAKDKPHSLWLSADSKGLRGADGRKYALDLARLNPVDITWLEEDVNGSLIEGDQEQEAVEQQNGSSSSNATQYPHRMVLLRQELLEIYWDFELRNWAQKELANKAAKKDEDEKKGKAIEGQQKTEGESTQNEPERLDASQFSLAFNPDAFIEFRLGGASGNGSNEAEPSISGDDVTRTTVLVKDEQDPSVAAVRNAGKFLRERALPRLVTDVAIGTHTTQDGRSLTRQMHARGINVRYLGYLAHLTMPSQRERLNQELLQRAGPGVEGFLLPFRRVVVQEMVVRAAKRVLRKLFRQDARALPGNMIAHFLNCLLGDQLQEAPTAQYTPSPFDGVDAITPDWATLSPSSLQQLIRSEVEARFRFKLPKEYFSKQMQRAQVLREICLRTGIQLKLRQYNFDKVSKSSNSDATTATTVSAGSGDDSQGETAENKKQEPKSLSSKKKKKATSHASVNGVQQVCSFEPDDVLNMLPVIKDSTPRSALADEAFEAGRVSMSRGDRALGFDLMTEGVSFHEQVYGLIHPETARCYSAFATLLHHYASILAVEHAEKQREAAAATANGEEGKEVAPVPEFSEQISVANALRYQRQAVTVSERTLGLDHPETLAHYVSLSVLERLEGNVDASLRCQQRLLHLLEIIHGDDHPEVINALNNVALTLQNARQFENSLKAYQASFAMALRLYGKDSINTAYLGHELSQAYTLASDLKKAIEVEKEANKTFEIRLGKEDNMTRESTTLLNNLAASAVRIAKMDARQKEMTRLGLASQAGQGQAARRLAAAAASAGGAGAAATGAPGSTATATPGRPIPDLSNKSLDDLVKFIQGGSSTNSSNGGAKSSSSGKASANGKKKLGGGNRH